MSVDVENTKKALDDFGKYLVKQARTNLTKNKKNSSKKLYDSIGYDVKVSKNSFSFTLSMEDYGEYQDKGVSGVKKKYNTPFKYTNKMPPAKAFDKWLVRKGIAPRNVKGQFQTRKGLAFAIARGVFYNGIKPSLFVTKPFNDGFERLDDTIIEAFGLDVETFLNYILNKK